MPRRKPIGDPEDRARFVARLRETIRAFGSANALATAAGVSEGALRKWLAGSSEPTRDRLVAIARAAGVNVAWLATGGGPKDRSGSEDVPLLEGYVALPRVGGEGDASGEVGGDGIAFEMGWLRSWSGRAEAELATVQVPDDSMAPLLPAGATLVMDRSGNSVSRDGIYALRLDGALVVRRLQRMPGGEVQASADSPAYQPFRFRQDDPAVDVLGRVVWVGHEL